MFQRWERLSSDSFYESNEQAKGSSTRPLRLVDKMLTNWSNVGFIQFMYPSALIIHVARNPMDTAFSCYKHEFMVPGLDVVRLFRHFAYVLLGYLGISFVCTLPYNIFLLLFRLPILTLYLELTHATGGMWTIGRVFYPGVSCIFDMKKWYTIWKGWRKLL